METELIEIDYFFKYEKSLNWQLYVTAKKFNQKFQSFLWAYSKEIILNFPLPTPNVAKSTWKSHFPSCCAWVYIKHWQRHVHCLNGAFSSLPFITIIIIITISLTHYSKFSFVCNAVLLLSFNSLFLCSHAHFKVLLTLLDS